MKKHIDIMRAVLLLGAFMVIPVGIGGWRPELLYWNAALWKDLWLWAAAFALVTLLLSVFKSHRALLLCGGTVAYLGIGVGLPQFCTVAYLTASVYAMGRLLLYAVYRKRRSQPLLVESILMGAGAYSALFAVLIHFPVNYPLSYGLLLALPVAAGLRLAAARGPLCATVGLNVQHLSAKLTRIGYWQLAGALCVIAYVARYAFYPTLSYDDNALHLRIWTTLAYNHVYDFDIHSQVWAVAPFVVDLLAAIPSVLAGANARGAFNLALLAFLLYSMWQLARLINRSRGQRLVLLVLFVSTPLTAFLMAGQQTEFVLSVVATSAMLLVLRRSSALASPALGALIMAAALCCGIKVNGAILGLTLLAVWACRFRWRQGAAQLSAAPRAGLLMLVLLAAFVAFQAYAYAWYATGNPVLPLYNGIFKSPAFEAYNFTDPTYTQGASLRAFWDMYFQTNKHLESANYVGGFQYLLVLPLALLMLFGVRRRATWLLVPVLGFGFLMFYLLQYQRYLYPVLPLASVLIGAVMAEHGGRHRVPAARLAAGAALLLFGAVNLFFLPGVIWFFSTPPRKVYTEAGRLALVKQLLPEQYFNRYLNEHAPGAVALYEPVRPYGASLAALPAYVNWYSRARELASWQLENDAQMTDFLNKDHVQYVNWEYTQALEEGDIAGRYRRLLREHLSQFGVPEMAVSNLVLYRLQGQPLRYRPAVDIVDFSPLAPKSADTPAAGAGPATLSVSEAPLPLREFALDGARAIRLTAQLDCAAGEGRFIAQVNWDQGAPYFHTVPCFHAGETFIESFPIPQGATKGTVFATRQAGGPVVLKQLKVELY